MSDKKQVNAGGRLVTQYSDRSRMEVVRTVTVRNAGVVPAQTVLLARHQPQVKNSDNFSILANTSLLFFPLNLSG